MGGGQKIIRVSRKAKVQLASLCTFKCGNLRDRQDMKRVRSLVYQQGGSFLAGMLGVLQSRWDFGRHSGWVVMVNDNSARFFPFCSSFFLCFCFVRGEHVSPLWIVDGEGGVSRV